MSLSLHLNYAVALFFAVLWAYNKGVNNKKKKEISDDNDKND
jgi:hypothetical protein